ncbi:MAG: acetyl-coenzyme A carboxylase carboxyl transferase subunit beta [Fimbriimonadales bacterium]|nr:MAG: acetyl-coenzyme A carboxylase carboxyl transferase subunit beta [Fimbriimonadales bacterium]
MRPSTEVFLRCGKCNKPVYAKEFEKNLRVCPRCGHHHRLTADQRIEITFDPGSFEELDTDLKSANPLSFPDYVSKLERGFETTGRHDPIVRGRGTIGGIPVSAAISDFTFMGGSMGSVAGEKITRTLELALEERIPAVVFTATGGARMQEGLLSLMQMAKTAGACRRLSEAGVPYICVFTDPTMAGVLASYASLADIILAEPGALVGFAGARVSAQAQVNRVPDNFQTSEFNWEHGMVDKIVPRSEMRQTLIAILSHVTKKGGVDLGAVMA